MPERWIVFDLHTRWVHQFTNAEAEAAQISATYHAAGGVGLAAACSCWPKRRGRRPMLCVVDQEGLLHVDGCPQVPNE